MDVQNPMGNVAPSRMQRVLPQKQRQMFSRFNTRCHMCAATQCCNRKRLRQSNKLVICSSQHKNRRFYAPKIAEAAKHRKALTRKAIFPK